MGKSFYLRKDVDLIEDLCAGIVAQCAKDYVKAAKRLRKNPNDEKADEYLEECIEFFYSDWCSEMTNIDIDWLIDKLDEEVYA